MCGGYRIGTLSFHRSYAIHTYLKPVQWRDSNQDPDRSCTTIGLRIGVRSGAHAYGKGPRCFDRQVRAIREQQLGTLQYAPVTIKRPNIEKGKPDRTGTASSQVSLFFHNVVMQGVTLLRS